MEALEIGDPMLEDTDVGPLVSANAVKDIHKMVTSSLRKGGRLVCGGKPLRGSGFYYEPTVIAEVGPGYDVFDEETFGPVAAVTTVRNVDEAIDLANRTRFGLGASIWTSNKKAALGLVRRIEAGSVFINGIVKSDPRLPFGGVKASGHGRELSAAGIREFTNIKTVWSA
jgi:succinate-semialdehyde dehydrogenase/glutarate-semialdehyde dehydrogenase